MIGSVMAIARYREIEIEICSDGKKNWERNKLYISRKILQNQKEKKGKKRKCIIEGALEPAPQTWIFSDAYNPVKGTISP